MTGRTYILNPRNNTLTDIASGRQIRLSDVDRGRPVVAVDPGHGVMKPLRRGGAIYDVGCDTETGGTESQITQQVGRRLARHLNGRGMDVILTHDGSRQHAGDGFDFRNRAARASDLFIALHVDSAENESVRGSRVYANRATVPGDDLRELVADRRPGDHIHDNRDRRVNHDVTRPGNVGRDTPAILVEMGFGTNRHDSRNLNSSRWQEGTARELARDIDDFLDGVRGTPERAPVRVAERTRQPQTPRYRMSQPAGSGAPRLFRHDIESGDTYRRLSEEYGVSVEDLRRVNNGRVPRVGQEVIIPGVREITVRDNDTLTAIARRIAASDGPGGIQIGDAMAELRRLNPEVRRNSQIAAGDDLIIPANAAAVRRMQQERLT